METPNACTKPPHAATSKPKTAAESSALGSAVTEIHRGRRVQAIARLQLAELCRQTRRRRQGILVAVDDPRRRAATDGVPADVGLGLWQRGVDVQQSDRARPHDVVEVAVEDAEGLVEGRRAGALEAAGAGERLVDGLVDRQASLAGDVVGPEVAALVADGQGPGAGRLADEIEHVVGVCGDEVVDVFGEGLVVRGADDRRVRVGVWVQRPVRPRGAARGPPREESEILNRVPPARGDETGLLFGVDCLQVVDPAVPAILRGLRSHHRLLAFRLRRVVVEIGKGDVDVVTIGRLAGRPSCGLRGRKPYFLPPSQMALTDLEMTSEERAAS